MGKSYGEIFHEMATMPNVQWPEVWQAILETLVKIMFKLLEMFFTYMWYVNN
jgi:D-methionine transport system permease protein